MQLVAHGAGIAHNAAAPVQHTQALRREAHEAGTTLDEQDTERRLQLFDSGRQGRLCDAAGVSGAAEMLLARQGEEEDQLINHESVISLQSSVIKHEFLTTDD